ncbi:MAG: hypothetical protein H7Y18_09790 [Clostridiaceae bacterium]|nr:hypothetical protein [Clostridiaceae bacterium]
MTFLDKLGTTQLTVDKPKSILVKYTKANRKRWFIRVVSISIKQAGF